MFAKKMFAEISCARIISIPQTHLFESVMYKTVLRELYHEWKNADFVGTVAYSYPNKIGMDRLRHILAIHDITNYEFVGLGWMCEIPFWNNPNTKKIFYECARTLNKPLPALYQSFCACNYWMARPAIMLAYIEFFNKEWLPVVESHPLINTNATYHDGKLGIKTLKMLTGYDYYTQHPFVHERLVSNYMHWQNVKQLPIILNSRYGSEQLNIWNQVNIFTPRSHTVDFNSMFGDPCVGHKKQLQFTFTTMRGLVERYVILEDDASSLQTLVNRLSSQTPITSWVNYLSLHSPMGLNFSFA